MTPVERAPRKKKASLWRAALYGSLLMLVVRLVHSMASNEAFFPPMSGPGVAEFVGYLIPGIVIFVAIAYFGNRRIKNSN